MFATTETLDMISLQKLGYEMSDKMQTFTGLCPVDIVFWGSIVYGTYHPGISDIDFITFLPVCNLEEVFPKICSFHTSMRQSKCILKYLEGIYFVPDMQEYSLNNGIYIGTRSEHWRIMQKDELSEIDKAYILSKHLSVKSKDLLAKLIHYNVQSLKKDIKALIAEHYYNFDKIEDTSYRRHACESSCRSLYTYQTGKFISKSEAIRWVSLLCDSANASETVRIEKPQSAMDISYWKELIGYCLGQVAESRVALPS